MAMFIRAGWQDAATVNGTLGRYNTISNPQQVFIGPWDHGARNDADPFRPDDTPVTPDAAARFTELVAFFDEHLKEGAVRPDHPARSTTTRSARTAGRARKRGLPGGSRM